MHKKNRSTIKLGTVGAKFRRDILREFEISECQDFRRLDLAAQCLDRIETCRKEIEADCEFILDRFGIKKEHPALKVERDQKVIFCRIIREMSLDIEQPKESRPPALY